MIFDDNRRAAYYLAGYTQGLGRDLSSEEAREFLKARFPVLKRYYDDIIKDAVKIREDRENVWL